MNYDKCKKYNESNYHDFNLLNIVVLSSFESNSQILERKYDLKRLRKDSPQKIKILIRPSPRF